MPYEHARERQDYSDLASGKVFHAAPGLPAFPVRLSSEVLERCLAIRDVAGLTGRITLLDPCCGAAYLLGTVATLHRERLQSIVACDIDPRAVVEAGRNLSLLSLEGMDHRITELVELHRRYGKASHASALESARRLRQRMAIASELPPIQVRAVRADASDGGSLRGALEGTRVDVVMADVPYGRHAHWQGRAGRGNPLWTMLDALKGVLYPGSLVAVISDKGQKAAHAGYERVEMFQIGKRRISILRPKP